MTSGESCAPDPIPETSTQPPNARTAASALRQVIDSRKQIRDKSMTQMGEVYRRIAATDKDALLMVVK